MPDDDIRAVGTVECAHGAPLTVGTYRGHVNIAGRMLSREQANEFALLFVRAYFETYARPGDGHA
jgi:hypothetical protein